MEPYRCFRCSEINYVSETSCIKCYSEDTSEDIPGISFSQPFEEENLNFGESEPEENAVTTNEESGDSNFLSRVNDSAVIEEYFLENYFVVTSKAATDAIETASSRYDQICNAVRPVDSNFSSPLEGLNDFDMPSGSRDQQSLKDKVHTFNKKRIGENRPSPTKSRGEIYAATFQGISSDGEQSAKHCDTAMRLDATSPIIIDNSHLPSTSRVSSGTFSDTESYTGQERFLAIPGPSGIQRSTNPPNFSVADSKSSYSKRFCNICEKEYIEGYLHDSEHKCTVCSKQFQCRTVYNEHLLGHPNHFKKHCWICTKDLAEHLTRPYKTKLYKCCTCDQWHDKNFYNFISHNHTHQPQIFCKKCRKEYDVKEENFHASQFSCSMCPNTFDCKIQLDEHYDDHKSDLEDNCIVCKGKISEHDINPNGKTCYKCCQCSLFCKRADLQSHLEAHLGLSLHKCDKCEKRFPYKRSAQHHSKKCTPLPYRCEICRLRYSSDDSLHEHLLAKHT